MLKNEIVGEEGKSNIINSNTWRAEEVEGIGEVEGLYGGGELGIGGEEFREGDHCGQYGKETTDRGGGLRKKGSVMISMENGNEWGGWYGTSKVTGTMRIDKMGISMDGDKYPERKFRERLGTRIGRAWEIMNRGTIRRRQKLSIWRRHAILLCVVADADNRSESEDPFFPWGEDQDLIEVSSTKLFVEQHYASKIEEQLKMHH